MPAFAPGMSTTYRFGHFEIDADRRELRREDTLVDVQPKVLDVIVHLVRARDRVVSRQELLDELWGNTAVSEGVLTTAIHAARSALDDTASRGWAIKTVARHGYRFVASVSEETQRAPAVAASPTVPSQSWTDDTFVGRERGLARIEAAFRAACAGRGRVLIVSGDSGIGKTRLLDELMIRSRDWGALAVEAWCDAREGAPAYAPWREVLTHLIETSDAVEATKDLGAGAADLVTLVPLVAELFPELPEPPRLQSNTTRFRLLESIRTYLAHKSARQPILLLLDDLQSADHASLRLLSNLARELRHMQILVVAALRERAGTSDPVLEETLAEIARHYPGERMTLDGLSRADVRSLVASLTGATPPDAWVETILARSEGNPFFVKEIVSLLDGDEDALAGGESYDWATRVPPGVRDVILGRMHQLSEDSQQVLQGASVLGREFRADVLAALLDREGGDLAESLAEICAIGFVAEDASDVDLHHFSHGLIHETIYDSATSAQRKRLHRRAGEALESLPGLPAESSAAELAQHFMQAGDEGALGKAIQYAVKAAEEASALHAHDEAAKLYGLALDALERMAQPDEPLRCDLLIALGAARLDARTGDPRGRDSLLRAAEIARQLGEPQQLARAALAVSATAM